ncbi:MAG: DUF3459 domain-containing protein, partial [Acidobacteriota bacterium]|nr:DUF3459 domain-containing protein [Acidobacteriota bacterium]
SVRRVGGSRTARVSDSAPRLKIDARVGAALPDAGQIRALLSESSGQPNVVVGVWDGGELPRAGGADPLSRVVAALALLTHPAALIDSGARLVVEATPEHGAETEEGDATPKAAPAPAPGVYLPYKPYVPPGKSKAAESEPAPKDPLTAWYKQLAALHHGNPALRGGNPVFLDFDAQKALVWVSRAASASAQGGPVVVACNLSGSPVSLSLRGRLEGMGLRGSYLRTLLRSDKGMGPQDVTTVTLPAFGVYVGELRR